MMSGQQERVLSEKDQEIIAVGASVASGCLPCTKFHVRAASGTGAGQEEILLAVCDATEVRRAATEIMARAGGLSVRKADQPMLDSAPAPSLVRALTALGAAYAINCSTSLKTHLAAARALGASDRQMSVAIAIARGIKQVAVGKVNTAALAGLGVSEEQAAACGCLEDDTASAANASSCAPGIPGEPETETCSCRTADHGRSPQVGSNRKEE